MINRFALSFLCIELDRDKIFGGMLVYILLTIAARYGHCATLLYLCTIVRSQPRDAGDKSA